MLYRGLCPLVGIGHSPLGHARKISAEQSIIIRKLQSPYHVFAVYFSLSPQYLRRFNLGDELTSRS
jgi:hypothetical protein